MSFMGEVVSVLHGGRWEVNGKSLYFLLNLVVNLNLLQNIVCSFKKKSVSSLRLSSILRRQYSFRKNKVVGKQTNTFFSHSQGSRVQAIYC